MTLEAHLFSALAPLVNSRIFPDVADFDTPRPYIVWQQIGGAVVNFVEGAVPSCENAVIQITCWAETRAQAKELIKTIESTLITHTVLQARPQAASISVHEPELFRYGSLQDFSVWATR